MISRSNHLDHPLGKGLLQIQLFVVLRRMPESGAVSASPLGSCCAPAWGRGCGQNTRKCSAMWQHLNTKLDLCICGVDVCMCEVYVLIFGGTHAYLPFHTSSTCVHSMFGDSINLAARLMGIAARGPHAVLCDFRTREMARDAASFVALEPMLVKVGSQDMSNSLGAASTARLAQPASDRHMDKCISACKGKVGEFTMQSLLYLQGKKFPVDVFGVLHLKADAEPAPSPPAATADLSFGQTMSVEEDTSTQAADLDEAASLNSSLHAPPQQTPIVGRQVPCTNTAQVHCLGICQICLCCQPRKSVNCTEAAQCVTRRTSSIRYTPECNPC